MAVMLPYMLKEHMCAWLKGELHSKMTLKGMKEDVKTNISSILVFSQSVSLTQYVVLFVRLSACLPACSS